MSLTESDTRAKLIDSGLHARGWTKDRIRREETAGAIQVIDGKARKARGRVDYVLRVKVNATTQRVAVALIEAQAEKLPPGHGMEQAKAYGNAFGSDAAAVSGDKPQKNARILIATYQTLGVDQENSDANFLSTHYPENYFSHIVIDECHRSVWGKWFQVLDRNRDAIQIGLTATPRQIEIPGKSLEAEADRQIHLRGLLLGKETETTT